MKKQQKKNKYKPFYCPKHNAHSTGDFCPYCFWEFLLEKEEKSNKINKKVNAERGNN